jgi:hypothetical protein
VQLSEKDRPARKDMSIKGVSLTVLAADIKGLNLVIKTFARQILAGSLKRLQVIVSRRP